MKRILIAIAAASIAFTANAADLKKGEELVNKSGCIACHGEGLNKPLAPEYPKLAGQHADYLYAALKAYKVTNNPNIGRNNAIMGSQIQTFSDADMQNIAAYVEKQTPGLGTAKNKASIELGQKIYRGGIASKQVAACAGCHSPNGVGIPAQYPRLSGQWAEYTEAQLVAYRQGDRKNSAQMAGIASRMSDAEIKAVADYIAGLR